MAKVIALGVAQDQPGLARYAALAEMLRHRVVRGEWPPGSALPAEQALAAEHGVALGTLRRALELLVDQGLIERIHGRGTFVRSGIAGASMLRFFRFGDGRGDEPASRVLSCRRMAAPAAAAQALGLATGASALRVQRLRLIDGEPCLSEQIWLPADLFGALEGEDPGAWDALLYPFYASRCGVHIQRAVDDIGFGMLTAPQARALGLQAGHPCAVVTRRAMDFSGRCVEWRVTRGDAHAFHYTVTLT
ncbi:GntR family transcriptional regulator [Paracidovorax anthurii]|uniref:GntR family transcriptional regulator n=1 Tax=Paracidovorax anthurii TaxID=78229 RepID=A0A328ZCY8_9BURK|nr:GntR family transcriptional regulator [Paracidovorax anthurii]RAR80697.1 GntR family transcriptional regulator [Paracidovorax anthurii]